MDDTIRRHSPNAQQWLLPLFFCSMLLGLSSCFIEENPDLLNPPIGQDSIRVRLLNLGHDQAAYSLGLENTPTTTTTPYAAVSEFLPVEKDSLRATILRDSEPVFTASKRLRFLRKSFNTVIALPGTTIPGVPPIDPVDTLLLLSTIRDSTTINEDVAFLRFVNVVPDTTLDFTLRLGCPNGEAILNRARYMLPSAPKSLAPGPYVVSLISRDEFGTTTTQLRQFTLRGDAQYALILYEYDGNDAKMLLLDERTETPNALLPVIPTEETESEVRVANFSSQPVSVRKGSNETIVTNLAGGEISAFASIAACGSQNLDTIIVDIPGGDVPITDSLSLEVVKEYTVLVSDSAEGMPGGISIALPYEFFGEQPEANVRVVNLSTALPELDVFLGARTTETGRFTSGETVGKSLRYLQVSEPVALEAGVAPLLLFSSAEPRGLLGAAFATLSPQQRYLLVVTDAADNSARIHLINEDDKNAGLIQVLESGVYTQVINAMPYSESINFSYGDAINNAELFFSNFAATVLAPGAHSISAGGAGTSITLNEGERTLVVVSGRAESPDISAFSGPPLNAGRNQIIRRFVNASLDADPVNITLDSLNGEILAENLAYRSISEPDSIDSERRVSLWFWQTGSQDSLAKFDGVQFTFGKNYSIIFTGFKNPGASRDDERLRFRTITLQEF